MVKLGSRWNAALKWDKINGNELKDPGFAPQPGKLKTLSDWLFRKFPFTYLIERERNLLSFMKEDASMEFSKLFVIFLQLWLRRGAAEMQP
jgi:hypothetical protein